VYILCLSHHGFQAGAAGRSSPNPLWNY